jgi:uncharacterized protein involved in exopolysaccharide biosynthesis
VATADQPMSEREADNANVVDFRSLTERLGFLMKTVRRHKLLATTVFMFVVAGAGLGLAVLPKTYRVESRLLIRNDALLPSVAEPGRGLADAESSPLRSARDMITARDSLVALIRRTDLLNQWSRSRAPVLRVKDLLFGKVYGPVSEQDRLEGFVNLLRRRLVVWDDASGRPNDGTVTITVEWPDAQMAFRLVEAAQQGFIEARHIADMSAIAEASSILETHAATWRAEALEAEDGLRKVRVSRRSPGPSTVAAVPLAPRVVPRPREAPDPEAERLTVLLAAKQRVITDLEDLRRRNLADLQRRLAEQRAIYTDRHPYVVSIQQSIDALSQESPQLTTLRQEAKDLEAELTKHSPKVVDSRPELPALPQQPILRAEPPHRAELEDPEVDAARARLKFALDKYQGLRARADNVDLELEARRAAFKYRYTVIVPAELPRGPIRPKVALVAAGAIIAGLALGVLAAVLADLRTGRILETWQVERALKLPVISEVRVR